MKTCTHCGRENEDNAAKCLECGTELTAVQEAATEVSSDEPDPGDRLDHIAVLDNQVQADLVDAMLSDRKIPHVLQSYHDSAYDGLFQMGKGWGRILAPPEFRQEILGVLQEVKRQAESGNQPPEG